MKVVDAVGKYLRFWSNCLLWKGDQNQTIKTNSVTNRKFSSNSEAFASVLKICDILAKALMKLL